MSAVVASVCLPVSARVAPKAQAKASALSAALPARRPASVLAKAPKASAPLVRAAGRSAVRVRRCAGRGQASAPEPSLLQTRASLVEVAQVASASAEIAEVASTCFVITLVVRPAGGRSSGRFRFGGSGLTCAPGPGDRLRAAAGGGHRGRRGGVRALARVGAAPEVQARGWGAVETRIAACGLLFYRSSASTDTDSSRC